MAEQKIKNVSPSVGNQAVATTLGDTTKLDIDTKKTLVDDIIDYGLTGGLNVGEIEKFTSIANSRDQIYTVIDKVEYETAKAELEGS